MMGLGLFDALKICAGAILAAALVYPVAHKIGKGAGQSETKTLALETTIEILKDREITNAEITFSDAAVLCRHFRLPDHDIPECMRRVAAAASGAGHGSTHNGQ